MAYFITIPFHILKTNLVQRSFKSGLCIALILFLFYGDANAQVTTIANASVVTVAVSATASTPGDITVIAGGAINNSGNIVLGGNWTNNGSFTDVSGTVTFNATTTGKTISGLLTGSNKFYHIVFNGAGAAWSFSNDAEAGGNFSLTNGTVTAPALLTLDGNLTQTNGSFVNNSGLVLFKGTTAQAYSATNPISFYNLTNNNSYGLPGLSINSDLVIENELKLISLSKLNLVSGNITLRSAGSRTADIAAVPNETNIIQYGTGRFIVERYIPTGVSHGKSWQLLAAPASGQSINQSWMEGAATPNANPNSGFGTQIAGTTGTAGGFDATATVAAMKYYVPLSNTWLEVGNPVSTAIHNGQGYFIFVRGDRSVINFSGANSSPLPTILRTKGTIQTGALSSPAVTAGLYQSVANPYPSAIDFSTITRTGGVDPNFYLFDPTLSGSYGFGGYQTISAATGYLATPGNVSTSSTIYNSTDNYKNIQSGAAFLVRATGTNGTLDFTEGNKVSGSTLANRIGNSGSRLSMLSTNLLYLENGQTKLADGNRVVFNRNYRNRVDADDAVKIINSSENFGLLRGGIPLAVEARPDIQSGDTVFYNMSGVHAGNYKLMFVPKNLVSGISGVLIDKFLQTKTPLSLSDTAYMDVSVTANAASSAADRFLLVFRLSKETLPVAAIKLAAIPSSDHGTKLTWEVTNGQHINGYDIERSSDGQNFIVFKHAVLTTNKNVLFEENDPLPLPGNNFYRIKASDNKGFVQYSNQVKITAADKNTAVLVYPNPIQGKKLQLQFNEVPAGNYALELIDKSGHMIYKKNIEVNNGRDIKAISLNPAIAAGSYQLKISNADHIVLQQQIIIP